MIAVLDACRYAKRNKKMYLQIKIHVCIIKTNLSSTLKTNIREFESVEKHRCAGYYKNEVKQNKYECILSIRFVNIKDDDIIIFDVCLTISLCIGSYLRMDLPNFITALELVDFFTFCNKTNWIQSTQIIITQNIIMEHEKIYAFHIIQI